MGLAFLGGIEPGYAYSHSEIREAQQTLVSLGYKLGAPDGVIGPQTRSALRSFQRGFGLKPTGQLDSETLHTLNIASSNSSNSSVDNSSATDDSGSPASDTQDTGGGSGTVVVLSVIGFFIWFAARKLKSRPSNANMPARASRYAPIPTPAALRVSPSMGRTSFGNAEKAVSAQDRTEQSRLCWVPAGKQVVIAGHPISAGMIYVGTSLARQDGHGIENCLINPQIEVSTAATNDSGLNVPYYPSYAFLDPASRLSLLKWLEGGKGDPAIYIGYIFIYFYGLERRLMLDDPGAEASAIMGEVRRLLSIYHDNHSFERYATALLSAATVKFNLPLEWPSPSMRKVVWQLPLDLLVCLGRTVAQGKPLTAVQMLAWYSAHPDKRMPPFATRCPGEFQSLFTAKFNEKFPNGVIVPPPKRLLSANYSAASGSFRVEIKGSVANLPDVTGLIAPLNALDPLIQSCSSDLSTYARLIGKASSSKQAMAAAAALPAQLLSTNSAKPIVEFKAWLDGRVDGAVSTVRFGDLLDKAGIELPSGDHASRTDFNLVADALARCDFGVEPDPRGAYPVPAADCEVIIFKAKAGGRLNAMRPEYLGALAHITVGMLVASSDGVISPEEIQTLHNAISRNEKLEQVEQRRLIARLAFLAKNPPSVRILNRFKDRPPSEREAVARLAITVATADGRVAIEELRLLEKIFNVLQLPSAHLYSELQGAGYPDDYLPTVALGDEMGSVPIPPKPRSMSGANVIALDKDRLARTRADTAIVSSILGEIFSDDVGKESSASHGALLGSETATPLIDKSRYLGLDEKYVPLLSEIAGLGEISRSEFEVLANKNGLLCDGAIEAINDWAYTRFDEPFLDDGPEIVVHEHLLERSNQEAA